MSDLLDLVLVQIGDLWIEGKILQLSPRIRNWLGLALMPQAEVAIGLVLFVQGSSLVKDASPEISFQIAEMINIVLMGLFVNEVLGQKT